MHPVLATDYGNLYAFAFGIPGAGFSLALIGFGLGFRLRACHAVASIIFLGTGFMFLRSLPEAHGADDLTRNCAWIAFAFAAMAAAAAFVTRPRRTPPE
jgi:hypothetical protein